MSKISSYIDNEYNDPYYYDNLLDYGFFLPLYADNIDNDSVSFEEAGEWSLSDDQGYYYVFGGYTDEWFKINNLINSDEYEIEFNLVLTEYIPFYSRHITIPGNRDYNPLNPEFIPNELPVEDFYHHFVLTLQPNVIFKNNKTLNEIVKENRPEILRDHDPLTRVVFNNTYTILNFEDIEYRKYVYLPTFTEDNINLNENIPVSIENIPNGPSGIIVLEEDYSNVLNYFYPYIVGNFVNTGGLFFYTNFEEELEFDNVVNFLPPGEYSYILINADKLYKYDIDEIINDFDNNVEENNNENNNNENNNIRYYSFQSILGNCKTLFKNTTLGDKNYIPPIETYPSDYINNDNNFDSPYNHDKKFNKIKMPEEESYWVFENFFDCFNYYYGYLPTFESDPFKNEKFLKKFYFIRNELIEDFFSPEFQNNYENLKATYDYHYNNNYAYFTRSLSKKIEDEEILKVLRNSDNKKMILISPCVILDQEINNETENNSNNLILENINNLSNYAQNIDSVYLNKMQYFHRRLYENGIPKGTSYDLTAYPNSETYSSSSIILANKVATKRPFYNKDEICLILKRNLLKKFSKYIRISEDPIS